MEKVKNIGMVAAMVIYIISGLGFLFNLKEFIIVKLNKHPKDVHEFVGTKVIMSLVVTLFSYSIIWSIFW